MGLLEVGGLASFREFGLPLRVQTLHAHEQHRVELDVDEGTDYKTALVADLVHVRGDVRQLRVVVATLRTQGDALRLRLADPGQTKAERDGHAKQRVLHGSSPVEVITDRH